MANDDCIAQVQACRLRVAVLDELGIPAPGAGNLYVTDALTMISLTPVYQDGPDITQENACGTLCVDFQGDDTFRRLDGEITLCTPDPVLMAMLGAGDVLTDGGINGYAMPPLGKIQSNGVSLEWWANRVDDGDLHPEWPHAWWVATKAKHFKHGQRQFQNGPMLPSFTFKAYENQNWLDGPLNDWPTTSDRVLQWFPSATMPAASCGAQTLVAS
jgi:hypothetical protein